MSVTYFATGVRLFSQAVKIVRGMRFETDFRYARYASILFAGV
jgi:hypothetical protein